MINYGFVRIATVSPESKLGNCEYNYGLVIKNINKAIEGKASILLFPELFLTGYSCGDLFFQKDFQESVVENLLKIREYNKDFDGLTVVGAPLFIEGKLYNTAVVFHGTHLLGIVPKTYLPNYKEFDEQRRFTSSLYHPDENVSIEGLSRHVLFSSRIQFVDVKNNPFNVGIEICEDLCVSSSPSTDLAEQGTTIILNPSASTSHYGKKDYRRNLVLAHTAKNHCVYAYCNAYSESTSDVFYDGHHIVAENGEILSEQTDSDQIMFTDVDVERCQYDRAQQSQNPTNKPVVIKQFCDISYAKINNLHRLVSPFPFIPAQVKVEEMWREVFHIQYKSLAHRLNHVQPPIITIGISGGIDSTLSLLITLAAKNYLNYIPIIRCLTMPGLGTNDKMWSLANNLNCLLRKHKYIETIDICQMVYDQLKLIGHKPFGMSMEKWPKWEHFQKFVQTSENLPKDIVVDGTQARIRTNILMNAGFMIGTSDLSEMALGYTSYGGDHMSMYNPIAGTPKTLAKMLLRNIANNVYEFVEDCNPDIVKSQIEKILGEKITAGLVPNQNTEEEIGAYEIHDFIMYYHIRYGFSASKIAFLAQNTELCSSQVMTNHLEVFFKRFYAAQYKRNPMVDGPKVLDFSLSPRGDWRIPSDIKIK